VLVRTEEEGALAIGQLSHAWLSGQLARAWGNEAFPAPSDQEEIALGAEQHDLGWALFDLAPGLSPQSGLPRNFLETSVEEHLEIWRAAPDRLLSVSARAALVVSLHGSSLSELRLRGARDEGDGPARLEGHIADERARQERLRAALGLSEQDTAHIQRLMWTWDGLSLALCNSWDPFAARDVPSRDGLADIELSRAGDGPGAPREGERHEGTFVLDPWPFAAQALSLRCEARRLERTSFDDEEEMQRALEQAAPLRLVFELRPSPALD
jgi:hypothetical protein